MERLIIPKGYKPYLNILETEIAIKELKDYFEAALADALDLTRVSAPLFVRPESGLNDALNGVERPVGFDVLETGKQAQIVQSLAKWKRHALKKYGLADGKGLYADMNAIRRDEDTDNLHSLYVDQWDWEKVISTKDRSIERLKDTVRKIYGVMKRTEDFIASKYNYITRELPPEITFVTAQELEDRYPEQTPKERENLAVRRYGAVFLAQIGGELASGKIHDGRAPDYDDWGLNGDILLDYPMTGGAFEISSMGIRVDAEALKRQLSVRGQEHLAQLPFHKALLGGELPHSMGGGIGQSRLCMYYLKKAHVGEVQVSIWPEDIQKRCEEVGIALL